MLTKPLLDARDWSLLSTPATTHQCWTQSASTSITLHACTARPRRPACSSRPCPANRPKHSPPAVLCSATTDLYISLLPATSSHFSASLDRQCQPSRACDNSPRHFHCVPFSLRDPPLLAGDYPPFLAGARRTRTSQRRRIWSNLVQTLPATSSLRCYCSPGPATPFLHRTFLACPFSPCLCASTVPSMPSLPHTPCLNLTRLDTPAIPCPTRSRHDDSLRALLRLHFRGSTWPSTTRRAMPATTSKAAAGRAWTEPAAPAVSRPGKPIRAYSLLACGALPYFFFEIFFSVESIALNTIDSSFSPLYFSLKKDISSSESINSDSRNVVFFKTDISAR